MAMTSTLTRINNAINGQPTRFVLTVSNSGGDAVNVESIQPTVTSPTGLAAEACSISGPYAPVGFGQAQVNGSQFNVQVPASGSVSFLFEVVLFGPQVAGQPASPNPVYLVSAITSASDDTTFGPLSGPLVVALSNPLWGQSPGSPPNVNPSTGLPPAVGALQFSNRANSALAF